MQSPTTRFDTGVSRDTAGFKDGVWVGDEGYEDTAKLDALNQFSTPRRRPLRVPWHDRRGEFLRAEIAPIR
jgi:hypothetical protein